MQFVINPRRACARVRVVAVSVWVGLCVCVSFKSHLTSGASVRRENAAKYSAGNKGQKFVASSENVQLQRSSATSLDGHTSGRPFFLQRTRMCIVDTQVLDKTVHDVKLPTRLP